MHYAILHCVCVCVCGTSSHRWVAGAEVSEHFGVDFSFLAQKQYAPRERGGKDKKEPMERMKEWIKWANLRQTQEPVQKHVLNLNLIFECDL